VATLPRSRRDARRSAARQAGLASLAVVLITGLAAPGAGAYRFHGDRWPGRTIGVANQAPRYAGAVSQALQAWNRAHVGVRYVRAAEEKARVLVRYSFTFGSGRLGCEGVAGGTDPGYPSPSRQVIVNVLQGCRSPRLRLLTVAHELGHVLGLAHDNRRCALMNSRGNIRTGLPARCGRHTPGTRRLIRRDDIRGARALYNRAPPRPDGRLAAFHPGDGATLFPRSGSAEFSAAVRYSWLDYRWRFGDPESGAANSATGLDVRHVFDEPGVYRVTLRVLDGGAMVGQISQHVRILRP
jgi:PKD domain